VGTWIQTVVDIDATSDEAMPLGQAIVGWLVERDVVKAASTSRATHIAGPRSPSIVVAALEIYERDLSVHEFQVVAERRFHFSGSPEQITCPHCTAVTIFPYDCGNDPEWDRVSEAFTPWIDDGVEEPYLCLMCRKHSGLNDLQWKPSWAFGCLAFEFWDWPMLTDDFVSELSARLNHRTVFTRWKM
jgi:hypothetical protein